MSRQQRTQHGASFATDADFNEQLYLALKQSPWWMISIALHVFVFFIFTMLETASPKVAPPKAIAAVLPSAPPVEDFVHKVDPVNRPTHDHKNLAEKPVIKDEQINEPLQDDNDLDFNETFGNTDGASDAHLGGPSNNGTIGTGGGAGSPFPGRGGSGDGGGGSPGVLRKDAVMDALLWLKAHQSPGGQWEAAGFNRWCKGKPATGDRPDGLGKAMYDPGVSGLALCAFLGAGYTNRGNHPFKKTVARGLRYLKNIQDPEGCFGTRAGPNYIYNHAIASLAMVEAYGMTGSTIYKGSAQRSLEFIGLSRNPYFVWRYGVKPGDNDSSVTGWMMMALKSAQLINADALERGKAAPLSVDAGAFDGIKSWLDKMTDADSGRVGYITRGSGPARPKEMVDRFPGSKSESMTAVGVLARIFMGENPKRSKAIQGGAALMRDLPPQWNPADGSIDMYYWYYGALAMYQMGGKSWETWKTALGSAVIEQQRKDTDHCAYKGSWDPLGPWGPDGGRVYSTALMAMCLEVWYRYDRVIGTR